MLGEEDKRCHAAAFLSMDRRARCGGYFTQQKHRGATPASILWQ